MNNLKLTFFLGFLVVGFVVSGSSHAFADWTPTGTPVTVAPTQVDPNNWDFTPQSLAYPSTFFSGYYGWCNAYPEDVDSAGGGATTGTWYFSDFTVFEPEDFFHDCANGPVWMVFALGFQTWPDVYSASDGNVFIVSAIKNGTNDYTVTSSGGGDGSLTTHVIRINSPQEFATTTSPVDINFDIYTSSSTTPPLGYDLNFVNTLTYQSFTKKGWLVDSGYTTADLDTVFNVSTSTPLTGDGTWKLSITLWTGGGGGPLPDPPDTTYGYYYPAVVVWFGLNFNDNVQTIHFPPATAQYASTSCNVDFLGSFSLSDCVGYLFIPGDNLSAAYQQIPVQLNGRYPFSYISSISNTWNNLSVGPENASPTYLLNYHDLDLGEGTPIGNFLPNFTAFSASTTKQYFPPGMFDLLMQLAATALYLMFFVHVFFTVRNLPKT